MIGRTLLALCIGAALAAAPAGARQANPAAAAAPASAPVSVPAAAPAPAPSAVPPASAANPAATPPAVTAQPPAARPGVAQPRPDHPAQPMVATPAGSLLQTLSGLIVVLLLLALFAWVMKRFGPRPQAGAAGLRIVGALNLGGRERLMVVEIGDQWIVVGASPGRVNALATMPKQAASAATLEPHAAPANNFAQWLKQTIEQRHAK